MAFKYLSWALFPLLASYGVYSLMYHEHKGWYSWVLSMLYGFLLMFGKEYILNTLHCRFIYSCILCSHSCYCKGVITHILY